MTDIYNDGNYISSNPGWHQEDAPFKAKYINALLAGNNIKFDSVVDVGCGAGAVLGVLRRLVGRSEVRFTGFDISNQALALARDNPDLSGIDFHAGNFLETDARYDILMANDVFEHIPDYMGFLRACAGRAKYKIYHIPLDLHVSAAFRDSYVNGRISIGHLHYFSERTALAVLADTGHKVLAATLTPGATELARLHRSMKRAIANVPRRVVGAVSPSLSARLFGGYSLLVLAE